MMSTIKLEKQHMVLISSLLLLVATAGFVSHVSTNAVEKSVLAVASDLMDPRSAEQRWEFLRDGMVLGRILSDDDAVYLFTVRLFGGDHRYAVVLQDDGRPQALLDLGIGPVSPHSERITRVMKAHVGDPLEDSSALDPLIAHDIMSSLQTIAMHERSRKEESRGK